MVFKKRPVIITLVVIAIVGVFLFRQIKTDPQPTTEQTEAPQSAIPVKLQSIQESRSLALTKEYPATIKAKSTTQITAQAAGILVSIKFDLSDPVQKGQILATIDESGRLSTGEEGFKSNQIKQLEFAVETAYEALKMARRNYENTKSKANKTAKEIAEANREAAESALASAVAGHLVTAPLTGTVTEKTANIGDSVNPGQVLGSVSVSNQVKIVFFVDQETLKTFSSGQKITIKDNQGQTIGGYLTALSTVADPVTKKFLMEAEPQTQVTDLSPGTIASILIETTLAPREKEAWLIPISALTIGQNEAFIFTSDQGQAKKVTVTVNRIIGETAEITASLSPETMLVIENNKLLTEGQSLIEQK